MSCRWGATTAVLLCCCSPNAKFEPAAPRTPCTTTADCAPGEACDGFDLDAGTAFCVACSSSTRCCKPDGGGPPAGTPCTGSSDCGSNQQCVFFIGDCPGSGTCEDDFCGDCPAFTEPACTCAGQTVYIGCGTIASGYWSVPVASWGECAVDSGVPDASDD